MNIVRISVRHGLVHTVYESMKMLSSCLCTLQKYFYLTGWITAVEDPMSGAP